METRKGLPPLESDIVTRIRKALGREPDLILHRVSEAKHEEWDSANGGSRWVGAGMGKGTPDLVGVLRVSPMFGVSEELDRLSATAHHRAENDDCARLGAAYQLFQLRAEAAAFRTAAALVRTVQPLGRMFALEVKQPGKRPTEHQRLWAEAHRAKGAFVAAVTSEDEARAALERARRGESQ